MPWYFYLLQILSGMLLTNAIPHWVQGLSGEPFQSPFATPSGIGESSPLVNVLWGFGNLVGGGLLFAHFGPCATGDATGWIVVGAGALFISIFTARHFGTVRAAARAKATP